MCASNNIYGMLPKFTPTLNIVRLFLMFTLSRSSSFVVELYLFSALSALVM